MEWIRLRHNVQRGTTMIRTSNCTTSLAIIVALACLFTPFSAKADEGLKRPRDAADAFVAATASGNADAIAALYAKDAILLAPNSAPIAGRDAIRAQFARNFSLGRNSIRFINVRTDTGTDRAAAFWNWTSELTSANGAVARFNGRSLVYFVRTADGWLISADMMQVEQAR